MTKKLQSITSKFPAIAALALIVLAWYLLCVSGLVPAYMLPSPVNVAKALISDMPLILMHARYTLQQNSFDPIDAACSPDRQREEFGILYDALMASYDLDDKNEIRGFFNQLRQEFLDWHGTEFESPEFYAQEKKISEFYKSKAVE